MTDTKLYLTYESTALHMVHKETRERHMFRRLLLPHGNAPNPTVPDDDPIEWNNTEYVEADNTQAGPGLATHDYLHVQQNGQGDAHVYDGNIEDGDDDDDDDDDDDEGWITDEDVQQPPLAQAMDVVDFGILQPGFWPFQGSASRRKQASFV